MVCQGDRMAVYINGVLQNECSGTNRTGYIALQSEGGTLEFRNVYLTDVK
ncbi:MAG: family 16 glycoside hydrolase [Alistipes onderdonkii]